MAFSPAAPSSACFPLSLLSLVGKRHFLLMSTHGFSITTASRQDNNDAWAVGVTRRSADYKQSNWDYDSLIHSLRAGYAATDPEANDIKRIEEEINGMLCNGEMRVTERLEFIDVVQRLGLQRYFDIEIKNALQMIHNNEDYFQLEDADLYTTALMFRLLRQHGFQVQTDVFKQFMDGRDTFTAESLLSLYEASFYGLAGEDVMEKARDFAGEHLKAYLTEKGGRCSNGTITTMKVEHALEMPIHWRPNRLEARWFMEVYEKEQEMNTALLDFARLDFNMVQSVYRNELSDLARWWVELGLNKMNISRDRLMELYLWCSSVVYEPQHGACRQPITKMASMITLIDDVYDIYGTLDELQLLTNMVERWDAHEIDQLPDAMRVSFMALYETTNRICDWASRDKGIDVRYQCRAYLQEATWYHEGIKPTVQQYLECSTTTVGVKIMLLLIYFLTTDDITQEALDWISQDPSVIPCTALICRLNNDLGTSTYELARGDNVKAVECYMNEAAVTEEVARRHIEHMVNHAWKAMNEEVLVSKSRIPGSEYFVEVCMNYARASQSFDKYGDGHDVEKNHDIDGQVKLVLVEPIPKCSK
ncbi:hypothetical protein MLD38_010415 [Melastoma candidum]|uniref:Uncharacterized protein n=1 Tax=Melastoma candidum TaxID=119954 RepID=A0ACB9R0T9_9MYRT|nr:hypothetical protein MLD38_010415 [Melastoma candidum]